VAVYFRLLDREGDVVKRGGEIRIKLLLDNRAVGAPKLLNQTVINDPEQLREAWYGKLWTNHYKVVVPFAPDVSIRPGQEVGIHVTFVDFATGVEYTDIAQITASALHESASEE